ncbi:MAG: sporulation integral membrane protein YtvI [Candidatus Avilachnospira sp.]
MKNCLRCILNITFPILTLVLLVTVGLKLVVYFLPFVAGYLLAALANPLSVYLRNAIGIKRKHSSVMIMIVVLALIILLLYLAGSWAFGMAISFVNSLPEYIGGFLESINDLFVSHEDTINKLPENIGETIFSLRDNLNTYISDLMGKVVSPTAALAGSAVKSIPIIFIYGLITVLSAFSFMIEWENVQAFLKRNLPKQLQNYLSFLKNDMKNIILGWLLAQFKIMFVVFAVLFIGFMLLRVKYGIWLALLTAFLDFLPALGVGFIMWPWIALEILSGNFLTALWLSVIYIGTQVVRQTLQPKIMGDTMGLPPLWTLFFLYMGFKLYGIAGMIFSVPIGMLFLSIYRYGFFDRVLSSAAELTETVARFMNGDRDKN